MNLSFVDHYEELQVSPNADRDTISRVFRHLAKRYHPDNPDTGDAARFARLLAAHEVLTDPAARARHDIGHKAHWDGQWSLVSEAGDGRALDHDQELRAKILAVLYTKRRREPRSPGLGDYTLASMLDTPVEHLEFHLWYLRSRGTIDREQSGTLVITADGVDQVEQLHGATASGRLLVLEDRKEAVGG